MARRLSTEQKLKRARDEIRQWREEYKSQQSQIDQLKVILDNREKLINETMDNARTLLKERNELLSDLEDTTKQLDESVVMAARTVRTFEKAMANMIAVKCKCGNDARYVNEHGELCCSLCPLKEKIDSIQLAKVAPLLAWCRDLLALEHKEEIRDGNYSNYGSYVLNICVPHLRDIIQRHPMDGKWFTDPFKLLDAAGLDMRKHPSDVVKKAYEAKIAEGTSPAHMGRGDRQDGGT